MNLSCSREVYAERVKKASAEEWNRACKVLRDKLGDGAEELVNPFPPVELCELCMGKVLEMVVPASLLIRRARRALW